MASFVCPCSVTLVSDGSPLQRSPPTHVCLTPVNPHVLQEPLLLCFRRPQRSGLLVGSLRSAV